MQNYDILRRARKTRDIFLFLVLFRSFFTHPRYTGMGFAIARILKICFANIGEVTDRIELNFGMCITNIHTNISTTGFVKILLHC